MEEEKGREREMYTAWKKRWKNEKLREKTRYGKEDRTKRKRNGEKKRKGRKK